jgi:SAM-dependent methyltransferase
MMARDLSGDVAQRLAAALRSATGSAWRTWLRLSVLPGVRQFRGIAWRRMEPLSRGRPRGTPIARAHWARFLAAHSEDVRGRALEIGTTTTIRAIGGAAITRADAMDVVANVPEVTVVADLARADHVPGDTYDCFVNQFTLHLIADIDSALFHAIRILRPGGVLLASFPCLDEDMPNGLDMGTGAVMFVHRWFTRAGVESLLRRTGLGDGDYDITEYGNLFARIAYQLNLAAEELTPRELWTSDPRYPLLVCVRAVKPEGWSASPPPLRAGWQPPTVPVRWSPATGHHAPPPQ